MKKNYCTESYHLQSFPCICPQTQIRDHGSELEDAKAAREEATSATRELEKKVKGMETDVLRLQEELAISDRSRRNAEAEKEELLEEAAGNNPRV